MVEELLPSAVTLMAQVNMNERIVLWLDGLLDKRHSGLAGGSASFFHVAFCAGTNYIIPN